ncbi:hypothetical protein [Pseudomonas botevensis]|uniref:hypothetical protein n=1 Tax=Pseudomonas botevensis TaxID=2842352 RepID=UPI001C3DEC57|nr:hypothetical protein [Pseudomonas botevensis]MBV4474542.1 hypothetical protein [Pseudomonas botevensis]
MNISEKIQQTELPSGPNPEQGTDFDLGKIEMVWGNLTLQSPIVNFNQGMISANYLREISGNTGGTDNDVVVISLPTGASHNFQESYVRNDPKYHFPWAMNYEGKMYTPESGAMTGKFSVGYRTLEATIHFIFNDQTTANIKFKATKRN